MTTANDRQVAGNHYAAEYQHWDFVHDVSMGYLEGQITKYICRHHKKGGTEDLEKAVHYLQKLREERQKYLATCLAELVESNNLRSMEHYAISMLMQGNLKKCQKILSTLINERKDGPTPDYVNQDPDLKSESDAMWQCGKCGVRVHLPDLTDMSPITRHKEVCKPKLGAKGQPVDG